MQVNVLEWLEKTSHLYPEKAALCDENEKLTYRQYHDLAVGLADIICTKNAGRKKPVVVYLEKSVKMLVSFMGIAYSGDFYSPIDVDMPEQRASKILEFLQPSLAITTRALEERFRKLNFTGEVVFYEDIIPKAASGQVSEALRGIIDTDLLYVLFTSGSTGVPKGVSISHKSVIDYTDWVTEEFEISPDDCFGNQAPFYFDNSILDIYSCMKTGATLYIIPQTLFFKPLKLLEYLSNNRINTIFWVPSAMIMISKLNALKSFDLSNVLKRVLFCGEVMPNKQLNVWRRYLPNTLFANLYGPTEITDACTFYIVDRPFADDEPLPIGKPMRNTEILVLNEKNELVTGDESGELCVRGVSLAKGYYNNPQKTAEAFVQNPLNTAYPEIIYRTGDIVKYNEYGELMYLSRKDFQIKHHGYRIELGEIETAVSSLPDVNECCCLYDEKRSRIVLLSDRNFTPETLNQQLKPLIPEYMIPGKIVYMEKLPHNANGKIDRVKLKEFI